MLVGHPPKSATKVGKSASRPPHQKSSQRFCTTIPPPFDIHGSTRVYASISPCRSRTWQIYIHPTSQGKLAVVAGQECFTLGRRGMGYGTRPHDWGTHELESMKNCLSPSACVSLV